MTNDHLERKQTAVANDRPDNPFRGRCHCCDIRRPDRQAPISGTNRLRHHDRSTLKKRLYERDVRRGQLVYGRHTNTAIRELRCAVEHDPKCLGLAVAPHHEERAIVVVLDRVHAVEATVVTFTWVDAHHRVERSSGL